MAEERMLNDEILLGLIKANSGGGGGGTSDYSQLENLPQIGGETLIGNMSLADLGIASATDLASVAAALARKQDVLTAGDYISIANDGTINVTQSIGVYDVYSYEIKSINSGYATKITKRKNGVFVSEQDISNGAYSSENRLNVDNRFEFWYTFSGYLWHYKLLVDSNEHQKDEEVSWQYSTLVDYTETFNVSQDSSTDLATKGDVNTAIAGKQDTLTFDDVPTDGSNNPVKSNGIYDALALKQDATDSNLQTTADTIVGAINEHEGDIGSLKSGLTNVDVALSVPEGSGKNVLIYPFSDTTKTENDVTFTDNGNGTISTSGQSTARTIFYIQKVDANFHIPAGTYIVSKSYENTYTVLNVDGYNGNTWVKSLAKSSSTDDVTFTVDYDGYDRIAVYLEIQANINTDNLIFKLMIRPATITDPTFVPYIPSVESRIEAVESGLTDVNSNLTVSNGTITPQEGVTITNYRLQKSLKTVYLYMLVKFTPTLGTEQLLCILPRGYRAQDRILFFGKNGTTGKLVSCETDSYGAVRVHPTSDDSTAVPTDYFLTITYFTS